MNKTLNDHQETITRYMYLGLLPFFICAFGPWVLINYEPQFIAFFFFYSVIILAFLSGTLWAVALFSQTEYRRRQINAAIAFSLWPLLCFALPQLYGIGLMLIGFLLLLFWEKCFVNAAYPSWYQALRHKITFMVVACHMLTLWNIIHN